MSRPQEAARSRGRITTRLTLAAALVVAAAVTFITVGDAREQRNLIHDRMEDETRLLARTMNDDLANALYFLDIERLRHLGEVAAVHPEIESVTVFNREGRILVKSGGGKFASGHIDLNLLSAISSAEELLWLDEADSARAVHPIVAGGELLGGMLVEQKLAAVDAEIAAMIRHHLWEGLVVMLAAVVLSYVLARRLVHPVKELMEVTRRIAGGDLDFAVGGRRDDELGDLANSLETMRRELKESARKVEEERVDELRRANARLKEEVVEREAAQARAEQSAGRLSETLTELSRAQKQVMQHDRLRAEANMASGIAQDLSNTLQVILGVSENLTAQPLAEVDPERAAVELEMIAQASRDAAAVVARLRGVYPHGGQARFQRVAVKSLVAAAVTATEPRRIQQAQTTGGAIRIVQEVEDELTTYGSESELRDSLQNLIVNAIEAMPRGGTVSVVGRRQARRVLLQVIDTGIGMSDVTRLRAREPFFTKKDQSGSGLGLTLVEGIVARHSGSLEIVSSEGGGTTVAIQLPLGSEAGQPGAPVEAAGDEPLSILVVDDEESVRRTVGAFLELDRHLVTAVGDGVAAAERIERQRFDLVLTDRDMPGIDGVELAAFLLRRRPGTPVIMMTGMVAVGPERAGLPEGVDRMLAKPVGLDDLRQAIEELRRPEGARWEDRDVDLVSPSDHPSSDEGA